MKRSDHEIEEHLSTVRYENELRAENAKLQAVVEAASAAVETAVMEDEETGSICPYATQRLIDALAALKGDKDAK